MFRVARLVFNPDFNAPNQATRTIRISNGDVLDLDWYTDLNTFPSSVTYMAYTLGKGGLWKGRHLGVWEDPGERTAVRYIKQGRGYADIFTPAYMEQHCK